MNTVVLHDFLQDGSDKAKDFTSVLQSFIAIAFPVPTGSYLHSNS